MTNRAGNTCDLRPNERALSLQSPDQLSEDRHGGCVRTGHLDCEGSLNFVLRRCGFDAINQTGNLGDTLTWFPVKELKDVVLAL
jgi:hypothetical protein